MLPRSSWLLALPLVVGCIASGPDRARFAGETRGSPACSESAFSQSAHFDEVYRKACHNCYDRDRAPSLTAALDDVRSIEIDVWDDAHLLGGGSRPGAWYVRHSPTGGNRSNCSGTGDFAACLHDVRAWSDAHAGHEVLTVYVDKKQGWGDTRRPSDLDGLLEGIFTRPRIYAPADLKGAHATLRAAAEGGAWPEMDALRGKIIFVITGGTFFASNRSQHQYVGARGARALAFVAPDIDAEGQVTGIPAHFDGDTAPWVVFFNLDKNGGFLGPAVRERHYVARMWGVAEGDPINHDSLAQCVNFVAHEHLGQMASADLHGVLVPRGAVARGGVARLTP